MPIKILPVSTKSPFPEITYCSPPRGGGGGLEGGYNRSLRGIFLLFPLESHQARGPWVLDRPSHGVMHWEFEHAITYIPVVALN